MRIDETINLLRRFPQCAHLEMAGDRGIEDLRVFAPVDGNSQCEKWRYYRIDSNDNELPWLKTTR